MKILRPSDVREGFDLRAAYDAVAQGFLHHARGEVQLGAVAHLNFPGAGECHVKTAYLAGDDIFAVKLVTNFPGHAPENAANSGLIVIVCALTGRPLALLQDEGALTDWRTAIAGAIAAKLIAPASRRRLGIVGSGVQARLQSRLIARELNFDEIVIWARNKTAAEKVRGELHNDGLTARLAPSLDALCTEADLIVTTTAATSPLIQDAMLPRQARIIAVGADAPGKCELDPAIFAGARLIVADLTDQCAAYGEISWALRKGLVDRDGIVELGALLQTPRRIADSDRVIVDLTGLGIQDVQIAKTVWSRHLSDTAVPIAAAG